jgi:hypothetical protein
MHALLQLLDEGRRFPQDLLTQFERNEQSHEAEAVRRRLRRHHPPNEIERRL